MAEHAHLSEVDPEIVPHLESLRTMPLIGVDVPLEEVRGYVGGPGLEMMKSKYESHLPPSSTYTVTSHSIDLGGGVKRSAKNITPTPQDGEDDKFPALFTPDTKGFIMGNADTDDYRLRIASVKCRLSIVIFEYRLAPENPFPTAVNDSFAGLKHLASHPGKFCSSLEKGFLVGGTSAGGNLAAVLSHLARDDPFFGDTPLTGQLLHIPIVLHHQAAPEEYQPLLLSFDQNKEFGRAQIINFIESYNPDPTDTRFSPLLLDSHNGLPPAYLQVCGLDPLRDEGLLYEQVLREAGVPTKLDM
ncbi:hypothetical protein V5O48_004005 [Marasmius crinis-equi]|uniref:Alpha/beta hydrolase fold-3 domain-containing protein n=1 Tax=Marasmius crinis-equi TaxID=585013 RepID=A0ABR3FR90_9AGAR